MAFDVDLGENAEIVYTLSPNEFFRLEHYSDHSGGHLELVPSADIDREKVKAVELELIAQNPKGNDSNRIKILVQIADQNEHKPKFLKKEYVFDLDELVPPGTVVGQVEIVDGDGLESVTVSIRDQSAKEFFSVRNNGELVTNKKLDFESLNTFDFWLVASDGTYSTSGHVIVNLKDLNDNAPSISVIFIAPDSDAPNSGRIEEEQEAGTLVAFVNAQDADHGNNGKVQLRLLDSSRSFDLDENGKLTTKRVLDREIQDSFKMTIEACDQGADARCASETIHVKLDDINDNAPQCPKTVPRVLVSESAEIGTFIATAPISDKDSASLFGRLSFGLEPEAKFAIEKETGVISLNSQLDYESKSEWNVVIVATDGGGLTTRCKFVVLVEDANEAAPVFQHPTSDDLELLINENEQDKAEIFSVKSIDPDFNPLSSQGPKMTYKLDGAQELLKIDEISGEVMLNKSIAQLQEDQKTFRIIVTAVDSGLPRLSSSIQIQVSIRPGVETGLLIDNSLLKGGATIALIAILVSTIFIFVLVFLAVVFACRHKKLSSEYTRGSVVLSASGNAALSKNAGSTGSTGTGSRLHDDVRSSTTRF